MSDEWPIAGAPPARDQRMGQHTLPNSQQSSRTILFGERSPGHFKPVAVEPDGSIRVRLSQENNGFVAPAMDTATRDSVNRPVGTIIVNTDTQTFEGKKGAGQSGSNWVAIS